MPPPVLTHYELLGVAPDCSFEELRSAYRRLARQHHPDVARSAGSAPAVTENMARLNEAWKVLSDESSRRNYDATLLTLPVPPSIDPNPHPGPEFGRAASPAPAGGSEAAPGYGKRRQAWFAGVQAQMARLSRQAGRSATQTVLLRSPRAPRQHYEAVVEELVTALSSDAESRIRAARAAGAAPLDLGVAATLVGIRSVADGLRRQATLGVTLEQQMEAELLDRMWDVLAHELPLTLTSSLGGNPCVSHALTGQRRSGR